MQGTFPTRFRSGFPKHLIVWVQRSRLGQLQGPVQRAGMSGQLFYPRWMHRTMLKKTSSLVFSEFLVQQESRERPTTSRAVCGMCVEECGIPSSLPSRKVVASIQRGSSLRVAPPGHLKERRFLQAQTCCDPYGQNTKTPNNWPRLFY